MMYQYICNFKDEPEQNIKPDDLQVNVASTYDIYTKSLQFIKKPRMN